MSAHALQLRLTQLNRTRLQPAFPDDRPDAGMAAWASEEAHFLHAARARVAARAATAPRDAPGFIRWFEDLRVTGPGQSDTLFEYLATHCTLAEMRWFLTQEVAGEAGFDDLTALTLLRMPERVKLELARNFWDELGRGTAKGMHGPMLDRLARALDLQPEPEGVVWQALALANTMAGFAANRRYAYHSIGALGVVELTAPGRAACVATGLKRLGVAAEARHYFALHATLDVRHSAAWNAEVIAPLVQADPRTAPAIAEGALMRLECGAACFAVYRNEFKQGLFFEKKNQNTFATAVAG
jgi:hypothetical protein